MTGLDTNILVRYLTKDDPDQYERARDYLTSTCTPEAPCYLNDIVLCELVWVLTRAYGCTRDEIAGAIEMILLAPQLDVADREAVWAALHAFRRGSADFADCLIGEANRRAGCTETATLDRNAAKLPGFRLL